MLLETLLAVCAAQHGQPPIIWSIFKNRPFSLMFLAHLADTKCFDVTPVHGFDTMGMEQDDDDDIHMHQFVYVGPQPASS